MSGLNRGARLPAWANTSSQQTDLQCRDHDDCQRHHDGDRRGAAIGHGQYRTQQGGFVVRSVQAEPDHRKNVGDDVQDGGRYAQRQQLLRVQAGAQQHAAATSAGGLLSAREVGSLGYGVAIDAGDETWIGAHVWLR